MRSLTHAQVEQLLVEASSATLTATDGYDERRWWFIAERARLEMLRRHQRPLSGRCGD
jgi:hypothetical protein